MGETFWGDFVFAQPRLQARHAALLAADTWFKLEQTADFGQFLQSVRQTPLAPVVEGIGALSDIDEIENALRDAFAVRVVEVASWLPARWAASALWVRMLPLMPFHRHGPSQQPLDRFVADPELSRGPFDLSTEEGVAERDDPAVSRSSQVAQEWLSQWVMLWPQDIPGLKAIGRRLTTAALPNLGNRVSWRRRRAELKAQLIRDFRHHAFAPAAAFAHLGLVCLELGRLRGNLSTRRANLVMQVS